MGKKRSWFSAIKSVFTHNNSKDKSSDGSSNKEKAKGKGILRQGETKSFINRLREPSSIEKILGEADQLIIRPPPPHPLTATAATPTSQRPKTPPALHPRPISPRVASPKPASPRIALPKAVSPRIASPKSTSPPPPLKVSSSRAAAPKVTGIRKENRSLPRPEPSLRNQQVSATKIQAAYRGYLTRRSSRALRGLVRLQEVVRGQNAKRQTVNAMKQMQLLVRVQTQIQSRRIQMLENQALQHQVYRNEKEVEGTISKWANQLSEAGQKENWDDSFLTKELVQARLRKKVEAVMKRERAMAYAYSHQLWKANQKAGPNPLGMRSNGFPWWWNWLERQLPEVGGASAMNHTALTSPRPTSEYKPSPRLHASNYSKHSNFNFENNDSPTPQSSRSTAIPFRAPQQLQTPTRTPPPIHINYAKPRASATNSAFDGTVKDDDSLVSCPPFSIPNYMSPTISAKAKARANSNPKDRFPRTPGSESSRRFSFPLTPNNHHSFKWNKGGGSVKDSSSQKHEKARSIGEFSMDSGVSMPASVGRKPFNRFV